MENRPRSSDRELFATIRVNEDDSLQRVVTAVLANPGFHDVCVVSADEWLLGVINIKMLFRTVFSHHADPNLMTRQLIELASSRTAGHLMVTDPVVARDTDTLGSAVRKMVQYNLGDLPVVDGRGLLLGALSMSLVFGIWLEGKRER
jgi:CBS domain-containing protein